MSTDGPQIEGQEPESPEPETPNPQGGTILRVTSPWCTAFTFPDHEGGTIVVTRAGVSVLTKDADRLVEIAAEHGVTLTEVRK